MKLSRLDLFSFSLLLLLALTLWPGPAHGSCSLTTTGNTPLPDLGSSLYKGFMGGLYPDGSDTRPPAHEAAGLNAASQVQPLDATGKVNASNGKIVLISVGMSSVTQEWNADGPTAFMPRANSDASKNPKVTLVDGAQSGKDATNWADPNDSVYDNFRQRLQAAGASLQQVQVAWFEEAIKDPATLGAFPVHARLLQTDLETTLRNLKALCPNLRIVYMSSRDRAYTDSPDALGPEPYAYESGFSVQWTIADQINKAGNLNFDPAKGAVVAPYICWGPYVWADGTNPRSDGFTWLCKDLEPDFIHPSASGTGKVADQLLAFFKTDSTATPWFLQHNPPQPPHLTAASVPSAGNVETTFHFSGAASDSAHSIVSYQWTFEDGTFSDLQNPAKQFPAGGDYSAKLTVTDTAGNYTTATVPITVGGGGGPGPTPKPKPTPTPTPTPAPTPRVGRLLDISTRGEVGTGNGALIGGFIIQGGDPKKVLLRAIGPSLAASGIADSLADPTLELHDSSGAMIASNDNWQTTQLGGVITSDQVAAIDASGVPPSDSSESAIAATLAPGLYTAIVRGVNSSSGVGLMEVYDLDGSKTTSTLANISTRGEVLTADQVLIAGFIAGGGNSSQLLVRALGPSLGAAGITNALTDPTLAVHDSDGNLLRSNDDWESTQMAEIQATAAAPTDSREAAILLTLPPGNYTATVEGKDGGTGLGLVEVYHLQ